MIVRRHRSGSPAAEALTGQPAEHDNLKHLGAEAIVKCAISHSRAWRVRSRTRSSTRQRRAMPTPLTRYIKVRETVTSALKKNYERHLVEAAAKHLGNSWSLGPDREEPDFLVTEGEHQFGLEVCEIFTGRKNRDGSVKKKAEGETQRMVNAIRCKYEAIENIPLAVKFVGHLCAENMAKVVPALVESNLVSEPVGLRLVIDIDTGLHAGLQIHVTKGFRPNWCSVMDRVGWVDQNPMPRIIAIVEKKLQKLPSYTKAVGSDVRLLIIANRIHNSGRLRLEERDLMDKKGFQEIYFFSYPDSVILLD